MLWNGNKISPLTRSVPPKMTRHLQKEILLISLTFSFVISDTKSNEICGDILRPTLATKRGKIKEEAVTFPENPVSPDLVESTFPLDEEDMSPLQAFKKLISLRSKGERLGRENKKFAKTLKELKKQQSRKENCDESGEMLEEKKIMALEKIQAALEEQLEDMNTSIQNSIAAQIKAIRRKEGGSLRRRKKEERTNKGISSCTSNKGISSKVPSMAAFQGHNSRKRKIKKKKKSKMFMSTVVAETKTTDAKRTVTERVSEEPCEAKLPTGIFMEANGEEAVKVI